MEEQLRRLTEEELDAGIKAYGSRMAEIEKALKLNVEHLSEKEKYELKLDSLKNKKGFFFSIYKKYLQYRIKTCANKPPKKLNRRSRKTLEEKLKKYEKKVADFYSTKSFRNYEIK